MADWTVYMLQCKDGSLYTGITLDVARRFTEHQSGGAKCAKSLRGKRPLEIVWQLRCTTQREALQTEHSIKKLPREKKLLLAKDEIPLPVVEARGEGGRPLPKSGV